MHAAAKASSVVCSESVPNRVPHVQRPAVWCVPNAAARARAFQREARSRLRPRRRLTWYTCQLRRRRPQCPLRAHSPLPRKLPPAPSPLRSKSLPAPIPPLTLSKPRSQIQWQTLSLSSKSGEWCQRTMSHNRQLLLPPRLLPTRGHLLLRPARRTVVFMTPERPWRRRRTSSRRSLPSNERPRTSRMLPQRRRASRLLPSARLTKVRSSWSRACPFLLRRAPRISPTMTTTTHLCPVDLPAGARAPKTDRVPCVD